VIVWRVKIYFPQDNSSRDSYFDNNFQDNFVFFFNKKIIKVLTNNLKYKIFKIFYKLLIDSMSPQDKNALINSIYIYIYIKQEIKNKK
jgi:hypothetical protein